MNTEQEQAYWEDLDEPALRRIIQQQRKITYSFLFVYYLKSRNEMFHIRFEDSHWKKKTPMGAALSFLGQKLFA